MTCPPEWRESLRRLRKMKWTCANLNVKSVSDKLGCSVGVAGRSSSRALQTTENYAPGLRAKSFLELLDQHRVSFRTVIFLRYPSSGQRQQKNELRFAVSIASSQRLAKLTRWSFHPLPGARHCSSIIARQTTETPDVCDVPSVLPRAGFRCLPALVKRPAMHPAHPLFARNIIRLRMQQP